MKSRKYHNTLPLRRKFLIVCEGKKTEFNYFVGLRKIHQDALTATATSITVKRGSGGNAQDIVTNAIRESKNFKPEPKSGDRVFLLLDTEGRDRAPELQAAEALARKHSIEIIFSSPAFEYWLLCHFDRAPRGYFSDCAAVIRDLDKRWPEICKSPYAKEDLDIFDRLAAKLPAARDQALAIDIANLRRHQEPRRSNPSSQVYELIALMIGVRTGDICPIDGAWKRVDQPDITVQVTRGDSMPDHQGKAVHWMQ